MQKSDRHTYFLFGLALSFLAVLLGVSSFPVLTSGSSKFSNSNKGALLYQIPLEDIPRAELAQSEGKSIVADLREMRVELIENGEVVKKIPILSKGREGTFWETPQGNYSVLLKERNHFSSIGSVWMPFSMQFYGNFFIHGWPYKEDGSPVPPGYSGGCIRLSTEHAEEVFRFAEVGTPLSIVGGEDEAFATTTFRYFLRSGKDLPEVSAKGFIVADMENGIVLWERKSSSTFPAYGLSALMSSLVAVETVNQYKTVRMSELLLGEAVPRKTESGFLDEVPIGALVYPLLFDGSDAAAMAFAADHGERNFVARMNEKARAIGMLSSSFLRVSGSEENIVTPRDVFVLLRHLKEDKPFLLGVTMRDEHVVNETNGKEKFQWKNENPWRMNETQYRGGLLPRSESGYSSSAGIWDLPLTEFGERSIAITVLDSETPKEDIDEIKSFVQEHFVYAPEVREVPHVAEKGDPTPSLWSRLRDLELLSRLLRG